VAAVPSIGRATGVESPAAADAAAHDLYVRNYPRILRFCRSRLRSREDAEDAAQTTFAYAVGALRRGVVPTLESAWLLKIARNVCLNRWAASSRRSAHEVARDPQRLQELAEGHEPTAGEAHALYQALQRLTEQQRRAIVLREWQGLSYAEIADELELSQSAVETLIFRARRALARELRRDDRLRSRSGLGSLLAGLKSLLGGGGAAVKVAAGIAALANAGGIAAPRIEHRLQHHKPAPAVSTPNVARASVVPSAARQGVSDNPVRTSAAPKARRLVSSPITADAPTRADLPASDAPSGNAPAAPGADGGATSPPAGETPAKPDEPSQPAPPPSSPPPRGETDPPATLPAPTLPPPPALPPAPTLPPAPALPPAPDLPATPPAPALPPTPPLPLVNAADVPLPGGGVNLP
jgi:RNA polymerase sigma factor (sigma-70 family)